MDDYLYHRLIDRCELRVQLAVVVGGVQWQLVLCPLCPKMSAEDIAKNVLHCYGSGEGVHDLQGSRGGNQISKLAILSDDTATTWFPLEKKYWTKYHIVGMSEKTSHYQYIYIIYFNIIYLWLVTLNHSQFIAVDVYS